MSVVGCRHVGGRSPSGLPACPGIRCLSGFDPAAEIKMLDDIDRQRLFM